MDQRDRTEGHPSPAGQHTTAAAETAELDPRRQASDSGGTDISVREMIVPLVFAGVLAAILLVCMRIYRVRALHPEPGNLAAYAEKTRLLVEKQRRDSPDLAGINLSGQDASHTDFFVVNLSGANLADTDLSGAVLYGSDLRGADLRGADLRGAMLDSANLTGASLTGAALQGAKYDPRTKWPAGFDLRANRSVMKAEPFPSWQTQ